MVARKQSAFGGYNTSTEGVKAHVVGSCGCKAGWFEVAIQAVDWFVPEHHLSMYWFKVSLRCCPEGWEN